MLKFKLYILLFLILSANLLIGQTEIKYENWTYNNDIKSVQMNVNGIIQAIPVIRLNSADLLTLEFDEIGTENDNEFYYKIIHCDKSWQPSSIQSIEYIDGFEEERIREWQVSINTKLEFTHYWQTIPSRDTKIKISGNYILLIFNKDDDNAPLITRRFIVSEDLVKANAKWNRPTDTKFIRFKQQLALEFTTTNLRLLNGMRDIKIDIVQNGDWNNSLKNLAPRNLNNDMFSFDNYGLLSFWGTNEFRSFDTRRLAARGIGVSKIDHFIDGYDVILYKGKLKENSVYSFTFDFNGKFYIDNTDFFKRIIFDQSIPSAGQLGNFRNSFAYFDEINQDWQFKERPVRSDYANIVFSLETERLDRDVYVYGAFTDFQLKPDFKMKYDDKRGMYIAETILKQGYYDYMFAQPDDHGNPDFSVTEGTWQDTENEYKIIVYLSEFGARYDRVIGVINRNSVDF